MRDPGLFISVPISHNSKANISCFVCCIHFIMKNIPAHRDLFQFIEILQFIHILSNGIVKDGNG